MLKGRGRYLAKQDVGQCLFEGSTVKSRLRTEESETEIRKKRSEKADGGRKDGADGAELTYFRKLTAKGRRAVEEKEEESSCKHTNAAVGRVG